MRADQWFILAIGGLGVYAVIKLVTNKTTADVKPEDVPVYRPAPPAPPGPTPGGIFLQQNIIGQNAPPGSALLRAGQPYRGRLELAPTSTREQTAATLQQLGFATITVYMNATEAQTADAIPLRDALANPTAGSRWFQAVWQGPSGARALPREVILLWPTVTIAQPNTGAWGYMKYGHAFAG